MGKVKAAQLLSSVIQFSKEWHVWLVTLAIVGSLAAPVRAQVLFSDNFESELSSWRYCWGRSALCDLAPVAADVHGHVVSFPKNYSGGNIITKASFPLIPGTNYRLSFDYLGFFDAGGYIAISPVNDVVPTEDDWVFGYPKNLTNDQTWHSYRRDFTAPWHGSNTVWLVLEQNKGTYQHAFFDNIRLAECDDLVPPIIHWVTIGPQLAKAADTLHIVANVTDNVGVTSVKATCSQVAGQEVVVQLTSTGGGIWIGDVQASSTPGWHQVKITADDAEDNTSTNEDTAYRTAPVMGTSARGIKDPIAATASDKYLFRLWGRVGSPSPNSFTVDDGSGLPVVVFASGHGIVSGDFALATGIIDSGGARSILYSSAVSVATIAHPGG
jgi:hypothetical protein